MYAARDLEKHTMVIEYIGELIRTELAETREKKYEAKVCIVVNFISLYYLFQIFCHKYFFFRTEVFTCLD